MTSKIIVALDGMVWRDAVDLASKLSGAVWGFKLNDALFNDCHNLADIMVHGQLMLDPKLYDIPTTVANAVAHLVNRTRPRRTLITIHASAGRAAMKAAVEAAGTAATMLAVTALTSFSDVELIAVYGRARHELVRRLALMAHDANVAGLVCATDDLQYVNDMPFLKVVPGIRLPGDDKNDQVHVGTGHGADLVVVGRPITKAKDPLDAVSRINAFFAEVTK